MIRLVNDLLNVSRVETGKIKLEIKKASPENIIQKAIEEVMPLADKKGLYIKWQKSKTPFSKIKVDPEKLGQVIVNILDNSIHYTERGGIEIKLKINLPASATSKMLQAKSQPARIATQSVAGGKSKVNSILIEISDTGVGMEKEDLSKIFESFSRGEAGKSYTQGTGLGLYIALKIIEMHQGKIWAESPGKDKGSTFYIELPINYNRYNK